MSVTRRFFVCLSGMVVGCGLMLGLVGGQDGSDVDRTLDVAEILAALPPDLRDLAERLQTRSVSEAARDKKLARTSLQRHVDRLRRCFEDAGLKIYLE